MTWEEIEYRLEVWPVWFDWVITHLKLNADIRLSESNTKRNVLRIYKETGQMIYHDPISEHPIYLDTIDKFISYQNGEWEKDTSESWVDFNKIDKIEITLIGKANSKQKKGVICSSFNAG